MSGSEIEAIVSQVRRLSQEEQKQVVSRLTDLLVLTKPEDESDLTYSEMFGAGRGSFATPEEADAFLRRERDSWDN